MPGEEFSEVGVSGALAHAYAQDARTFLPLLAQVLVAALPDETVVERKGGLFQREKPIRKVLISLGDDIYILEDLGRGPLAAARSKVVRGITSQDRGCVCGRVAGRLERPNRRSRPPERESLFRTQELAGLKSWPYSANEIPQLMNTPSKIKNAWPRVACHWERNCA